MREKRFRISNFLKEFIKARSQLIFLLRVRLD